MALATGADAASLHVEVQGRRALSWHIGRDLDEPRADLAQMRVNRVYSQTDLPGLPEREAPIRALKFTIGPDEQALLALQRADRDFRAVDGMQLANLTPYLGQTMRSWRKLTQERDRAALEREIATGLGCGWMILGPGGIVTESSAQLRPMLVAGGARLRSTGRLEFSDPALAQEFQRAMTGAERGNAQFVTLTHEPPMHIAMLPAQESRMLGIVRLMPAASTQPVERVAAALGLSRSEARLAMLLCDGFSLRDAATELGWTIETARSCSKQIYARMGADGQSDVVRRMLCGPLWLAGTAALQGQG
ncbi:helix-turn-helix transcriptional regulator [Paracoccus laeviglucosivorans]|uniref:HTH luxR-type domain-containing protein n=1 Tax=Paracoccus laeviglucosivorans TaxID=1197861 RepID=A0A521FH57_9RHOB|nr:hypothetical protein [Paracoccus laeviglucosivorans]SMO94991.1 hypothetical protein SAMN06265221_12212 [Paracoccus laeviglucosivorans]